MGEHSSEPFAPQPAETVAAKQARLPLGLLIPLNVCRHENLYATWKCDDFRHAYEKCEYDDYLSRMKALEKQDRQRREAEA
ncbi:hypothetical protein OIO90_001090 [Microbotryomycetes sp. JL221]|nr:hypothetical protein OIO90_001090 [Microbotryomycetes sp. JL221]